MDNVEQVTKTRIKSQFGNSVCVRPIHPLLHLYLSFLFNRVSVGWLWLLGTKCSLRCPLVLPKRFQFCFFFAILSMHHYLVPFLVGGHVLVSSMQLSPSLPLSISSQLFLYLCWFVVRLVSGDYCHTLSLA